ncbi:uncharacterized protein LOC116270335 [Papio anubis]|uniref:uncharacterized protein LOC116270335 n=1 Tax=Papio anubis TaxID=9555 RepID=UPI0012ADF494|nr:uncharacterized protein LOC116270335 [Papio anubis]
MLGMLLFRAGQLSGHRNGKPLAPRNVLVPPQLWEARLQCTTAQSPQIALDRAYKLTIQIFGQELQKFLPLVTTFSPSPPLLDHCAFQADVSDMRPGSSFLRTSEVLPHQALVFTHHLSPCSSPNCPLPSSSLSSCLPLPQHLPSPSLKANVLQKASPSPQGQKEPVLPLASKLLSPNDCPCSIDTFHTQLCELCVSVVTRGSRPVDSDTSQKSRGLEKAVSISYLLQKLPCGPFLCSLGVKKKIKPSWKNQKADAPIIELGKSNRNLVMGVTGTHTSINLGGLGPSVSLHRCQGERPSWAEDLDTLRPPSETKGLGSPPSPGLGSFSELRSLMSRVVCGAPWAA